MNLPQDFNFTQSNLQDYVDCPYRFFMKHILRIKWPALVVDDALEFEERSQTGARFHRLIQQYLLGVPEDRLAEMAEDDHNPEVINWWEDFLKVIPPLLDGQRSVETILSTHAFGQRLLAKYDLVLAKQDGSLTVFDWKTSRIKAKKEWLQDRIQTRLYCWMLVQAGTALAGQNAVKPEQATMHYWFTASPEAPVTLPYSASAYEKDHAYFRGMIEEILGKTEGEFIRTSDTRKCKYCVYRSHCDRGIEAGDLDSYEDFDEEAAGSALDIDFDEIEEIEF
jgi:hypothetical protein